MRCHRHICLIILTFVHYREKCNSFTEKWKFSKICLSSNGYENPLGCESEAGSMHSALLLNII